MLLSNNDVTCFFFRNNVFMQMCICVCMYVCMYACMYVCIYVYMYICIDVFYNL